MVISNILLSYKKRYIAQYHKSTFICMFCKYFRDAAREMIPPTEKLNLRQHVESTLDLLVQEDKNLGREGTKVEIKVLRDREVGIEEIRAEAKVDREKEEVGIEVEVDKETEEAEIEVLEKKGEKKVERGKEVSAQSLKKKIKDQKLRVRKKKVGIT